jgi:hypothetical protein
VIASRPPGWGALLFTPGANPHRNLGRALAPELAGDADALRQLLSFEEGEIAVDLVGRWRRAHAEALLVVDQFEELFTLNPKAWEAFAPFRAHRPGGGRTRCPLRDDFPIRCSARAWPLFGRHPADGLGRLLRRAVVEPAGRRSYRFEDASLVEEMLQAVEGSRGALPLLAFALARLWETRDHDGKVLTRRAHEEIGGVAGALAQHAEATLERIGPERQAVVRELFRNLVTAEGTRAAVEREELLSLFPKQTDAAAVLDELIDARLLTSFELEATAGPVRHRVEVIHESLLKAWPRVVRWQAQDEEGAVLRDQLRQAAHLWGEKGRTKDLLWTGTAYREFELWRERYAGALTAVEEDFARSMAERARRRKRLRTAAVASVIVALAGISVAIGISRHQAAQARDVAQAEALRAVAGKLLALARTELDRYPTAALAYARKSLELADTNEGRRFAVEVLWRGPVARILPSIIGKQMGLPEKVFFGEARGPNAGGCTHPPGARLLFPPMAARPDLPAPPEAVHRRPARGDQLVTGGPASLRFRPATEEKTSVRHRGLILGLALNGALVTLTGVRRRRETPDREPAAAGW